MSELLEYAKSESSWQAYANAEKMADFNEEIIAKMAMAILPVDRWFPDGMYTEVYHDVESDIWLVRFGNWPRTAGGAVGIAFSGSDGRILMRWGEE